MKKILFILLTMIFSPVFASTCEYDVSKLSLDEIVKLYDKVYQEDYAYYQSVSNKIEKSFAADKKFVYLFNIERQNFKKTFDLQTSLILPKDIGSYGIMLLVEQYISRMSQTQRQIEHYKYIINKYCAYNKNINPNACLASNIQTLFKPDSKYWRRSCFSH